MPETSMWEDLEVLKKKQKTLEDVVKANGGAYIKFTDKFESYVDGVKRMEIGNDGEIYWYNEEGKEIN